MVRRILLAIVAFGVFGVGAASDVFGAQWYPFYGYRRPSYLGEQRVMTVEPSAAQVSTAYYPAATNAATPAQPCAPQVSTAYYPPAQDTAIPVQPTSTRQYNSAPWYPFYGNRRPSYLDR